MSCPTVVSKTPAPDSSRRRRCRGRQSSSRFRSGDVLEAHVVADARPRDVRPSVIPLDQVVGDRCAGHGAVAAGRDDQVARRAREAVVTCEQTTSGGPAASLTAGPQTGRERRDGGDEMARFIGIPPRLGRSMSAAHYRVATDRLPSAGGARVPHPGTARGRRRERHNPARRAAAARDARDPALAREPSRARRAARGGPLRRTAAGDRGHASSASGVRAQARARLGRRDRDPPARLRPPVRDEDFDLARFERLTAEAGRARARDDPRPRRPCSTRRSSSGAGCRLPTSPTSSSPVHPSSGSRSFASRRSRSGLTPSSCSGGMRRS